MDFHFLLPNKNSDLLNSVGDNYYVKQVYDTREIPEKLQECKNVALKGDPFYIFDHFDTYFSIIENAQNLQMKLLFRSFDLLYFTTDSLGKKLLPITKTNESVDKTDRNSYLNLTKMVLYLMSQTIKCIDQYIQQSNSDNSVNKKQKKNNFDINDTKTWEDKKNTFLIQLFQFMQLSLERLWNPPVAEENFVNMLCDVGYRTLETSMVKDRQVCETIFQILGTAIKRYNHAFSFPVRIMQILTASDVAISPIAQGVNLLHDEFGINSVFSVLVKDIINTLSVDCSDSKVARNCSTFLLECGAIAPKLVIPHLSTLGEELLNLDSYVLRNCVLQLMGDIVVSQLTSEELSEELKETRDELLEDLLLHINDVTAYVRSKVLQIWCHMKEENAVPLAFQHRVLRGAVERLEDKTPTVRKNAVTLIKSFLERNPFAAKLSLVELHKRLEEENEKMEKIRETMLEYEKKVAEVDKHWEEIFPELGMIVKEVLAQSSQEHMNTQQQGEELVPKITALIVEKKYREAVALAKQADFAAGNDEVRLQLPFEYQCTYFLALLKTYLLISNGCEKQNEDYVTQETTIKFLEDSIEFSNIITKALPKIQEMLMSKTNSDVFEAVDFFTTGYLFNIKGTECGMRGMLYLVWSGDKEKRDAVINGYKRVLFTTDQTGRAHALKVVKNLCAFLADLTYGHYTAMEELVKEWVEKGDIDPSVIQILFERFTLKQEETTPNESRQALQLLVMTSASKASICTANRSIIETIGFEERGLKDPRIYIGCISLLLNTIPQNMRAKFYKRYEEDDPVVEKVMGLLEKFFFYPKLDDFDAISMRTVDFFYQLCQAPDIICHKILSTIHNKMKLIVTKHKFDDQIISTQNTQNTQSTQSTQSTQNSQDPNEQETSAIPSVLMSRLIFMIGYMSMKEMIFLDIDIYNNMKFREELKENTKKSDKNKRKTKSLDMSASESIKRLQGSAAEPQQEPDEELVGATAEDSIAELINHICENELLYSPDGLLANVVPVITEICKYPKKYNDDVLQQSACLCLIRFMSLSSKFCEVHMPFLMNILGHTQNIKIKCNIVIGLSDLTFRFPNVIEPWTGHLYSTLHEKNVELRLTAVKMLSHLILHEMIRVKGQIADLAMCIVDENDEIKNITQQFFKEIANKSNILYNVLPDIISKLSAVNLHLEEEKYHIIMKYILGLIQKDRQVESLVEKLCLRFRVTNEERQWRDIAFCLSLLNYNERTMKKLIDNVHHFKDKVQVDEVHQAFKLIISNTSKLAKPELKAVITEFETRLGECFKTNDGGGDADGAPDVSQKVNPEFKKPQKKSVRKKKRVSSSESSGEDSSSEDERFRRQRQEKLNNAAKKPARPVTKATRIIESESSEDDDVQQSKRGRRRR